MPEILLVSEVAEEHSHLIKQLESLGAHVIWRRTLERGCTVGSQQFGICAERDCGY